MIRSFKDKETENIYRGYFSRRLPQHIQKVALRKLIMLNASESIDDLRIPPSNHLEKLSGKLKDMWSICINDQYRIIFRISRFLFECYDVEIVDYH